MEKYTSNIDQIKDYYNQIIQQISDYKIQTSGEHFTKKNINLFNARTKLTFETCLIEINNKITNNIFNNNYIIKPYQQPSIIDQTNNDFYLWANQVVITYNYIIGFYTHLVNKSNDMYGFDFDGVLTTDIGETISGINQGIKNPKNKSDKIVNIVKNKINNKEQVVIITGRGGRSNDEGDVLNFLKDNIGNIIVTVFTHEGKKSNMITRLNLKEYYEDSITNLIDIYQTVKIPNFKLFKVNPKDNSVILVDDIQYKLLENQSKGIIIPKPSEIKNIIVPKPSEIKKSEETLTADAKYWQNRSNPITTKISTKPAIIKSVNLNKTTINKTEYEYPSIPFGINNVGNTCFFNSLVQIIMTMKEFVLFITHDNVYKQYKAESTAQKFIDQLRRYIMSSQTDLEKNVFDTCKTLKTYNKGQQMSLPEMYEHYMTSIIPIDPCSYDDKDQKVSFNITKSYCKSFGIVVENMDRYNNMTHILPPKDIRGQIFFLNIDLQDAPLISHMKYNFSTKNKHITTKTVPVEKITEYINDQIITEQEFTNDSNRIKPFIIITVTNSYDTPIPNSNKSTTVNNVFDMHRFVSDISFFKIKNSTYNLVAVGFHVPGHYMSYTKYKNIWYLNNDEISTPKKIMNNETDEATLIYKLTDSYDIIDPNTIPSDLDQYMISKKN